MPLRKASDSLPSACSTAGEITAGFVIGWLALTASTGHLWGQNSFPSSGNVEIGTTINEVYDIVGGPRPLIVSGSDSNTAVAGSLASLTIVNSNTTANNTAQLNFATLNSSTSTIQHSPATISAMFYNRGSDASDQYPAADLVFATAPGYTLENGGPIERVRITSTGNVGIGTTSPQHLLHVAGTIGAEQIIVSSTGADYVFDPEYKLAPLSEIASYVEVNHHLPGIPSAEEMTKEGVSLGEMQTKLLAKVEELTLHMIEAEKKSDELARQNRELEQQVQELRKEISREEKP